EEADAGGDLPRQSERPADQAHRPPDAGEPVSRQLPRTARNQGQPDYEPEPLTGNPDPTNPGGPRILPFHKTTYCETADLNHSWNGTHQEIDSAMEGFTAANVDPTDPTGSRTMGYYDQTDLPFYYALYNTFATGDRYFASAPTQTFPNRLFYLAGTSFGHIRNDSFSLDLTHQSLFNLLHAASASS